MHKCKYCSKEFETKQKLARHIQACELNPTNVKIECPKCHKLFYWTRLKYHLAHCGPNNHNNRYTGRGKNWAKGLTAETSDVIKKISEGKKKFYETHPGPMTGKHLSEETKARISEKLLNYNHSDNPRNLHSKGGWYDGIYHMSTWELAYYIYCKDNNKQISRCTDRFKYKYNGKTHYYTPDYVVDGQYVEIKGREVEKDKVKYAAVRQSGKSIQVLYGTDIKPCIKYVLENYKVSKITELYN